MEPVVPRTDGNIRIAVCVPTYNRPEGLLRCLESIGSQVFADLVDVDVQVIVADNSASGNALGYVDRLAPSFRYPLTAIHVQQQGLCNVRNALFKAARNSADFLALIDDDEVAKAGWLENLLRTAIRYDSDMVVGPVLPHYEAGVPEWYPRAGMDHAHPKLLKLCTGEASPKYAAHNTLVNVRVLNNMPYPWFPPELNFAGSEDRAFFGRAKELGVGKVTWCSEARVEEFVPLSRTSWQFFIKRNLQRGSSEVVVERLLSRQGARSVADGARSVTRTCAVISKGFLMLPLAVVPRHRFQLIRTVLYGVGRLQGHFGRLQELYR